MFEPSFRRLRGAVLALALLSLLAAPVSLAQSSEPVVFGQSKIVVETRAGGRLPFEVEIAETPDQLHQGLMFRDSLPDTGGMLFLLPSEQVASFWMRNTFLPLDLLFIAHNGRITNIHHRASPGSMTILNSSEPVRGVLEINGGMAQRLGIRAGDHLRHPAFHP
ncbi:DUF192 domain-containing protein [Azospirillaceae bacterium]